MCRTAFLTANDLRVTGLTLVLGMYILCGRCCVGHIFGGVSAVWLAGRFLEGFEVWEGGGEEDGSRRKGWERVNVGDRAA